MQSEANHISFFRTLTFKLSAVLILFFCVNGIVLVLWDQYDLLQGLKYDTQVAYAAEGRDLAKALAPIITDSEVAQSYLDSVAFYYPGMELFVLDTTGEILMHASDVPSHLIRPRISMDPIYRFLDASEADYPIDVAIPTSKDLEFVFSAASIPGSTQPYYALVTFVGGGDDPELTFWDKYGKLLLRTILFSLGIAAITGVITWWGFTRRVNRAANSVRRYKSGHNHVKITDNRKDELAQVATAFNEMVERVNRIVDELVEKEKSRSELVATVSHELQTPLTVIQGNIETLVLHQEQMDEPTRGQKLSTIHNQINHLSNLIGDLFVLSILDTGQMKINREAFLLSELTESTLNEYEDLVKKKSLTIQREFQMPPEPVDADPIRIRQVIRNLVSNAVKFTPPAGTITLRTRVNENSINFVIQDTGIGIPKDEFEQVFSSFYRSKSHTAQQIKGTGLGLTICQKILKLHNSKLILESEEGVGTTFSFDLQRYRSGE